MISSTKTLEQRLKTGVENLDELLYGGFPLGSLILLGGSPGAGKTILSQQIIFQNASPERPAVFFQTLSEPTAKTLRYLQAFEFFDYKKLEDGSVQFVDLGKILRLETLDETLALIKEQIKKIKPSMVVIDSFKVFAELSQSREGLRKFTYEVAINLMAWQCTSFLLGEFTKQDLEVNPLSSIVDGILMLTLEDQSGERQRFIQISKLRGSNHSPDKHPMEISQKGIKIFSPKTAFKREANATKVNSGFKTGVAGLDTILNGNIPSGSSVLLSGVAGTGKTLLALETTYRGAKVYDQKSIFISFEETSERLIATGKVMGWDLQQEIDRGMVEIVFVPQTEILVERDLLMIHQRIKNMGATRVVVDSLSVFLDKIIEPHLVREKVFHLATIVQNMGGMGLFTSDIPYGSQSISRYGVEGSVLDGIILLSSVEEGLKRSNFAEVYKMRNTNHLKGRFPLTIGKEGVKIQVND